jgi:hypothetical protein
MKFLKARHDIAGMMKAGDIYRTVEVTETRDIHTMTTIGGGRAMEYVPEGIKRTVVAEPVNNPMGKRVNIDLTVFEELDNLETLVELGKQRSLK